MSPSRREFLQTSLVAGGTIGMGLGRLESTSAHNLSQSPYRSEPHTAPSQSMKILILGGTNFVGPHLVRYAIERGHSVSIFTRGRRKPTVFQEAFQNVERLIGDREDNLDALRGRSWDVVIDNSGRQVKWAEDSAQLLEDSVGTYVFTSSTGVYYPYRTTEIGEDTELNLIDESDGKDLETWYGVMKSRSELAVKDAFGQRALIVRPGYIVGPSNNTGRFNYWVVRLQDGGEVMVPGKRHDQVQHIDVRDLTEWVIRLIEQGTTGTYNATGPASPLTMAEFVYGIRATSSAPVSWTWVDDYDFLVEQELMAMIPWILPVGENLGSQRIKIDRALEDGLTFRPLAATAMDTLDWWYSDAVSDERRADPRFGMTPERETEILAAWRARGSR